MNILDNPRSRCAGLLSLIALVVAIGVTLSPRLSSPSSQVCATQTEGWAELSICLEKAVFVVSEPVAARLMVRNVGNQDGKLAFFPQQLFNLRVYTPKGKLVYDHSETNFFRFTALPDRVSIVPPGGNVSSELAWNQQTVKPSESPGQYLVQGLLLSKVSGVTKWPMQTPWITIEVR